MKSLTDKTALVTGGGSGIGRSLVLALARAGARIVVADIMLDNARAVADHVEKSGGRAIAVHCDVCDADSLKALKRASDAAFGPVSLLFANAGATSFEPLNKMAEHDIDWIMHVNLIGVTRCIKTFLADMVATGEGHIVATASAAGLLPFWIPYHAPYAASKAGIIGLMLNLRHELDEAGIGATVLCPFGVATNMQRDNQRYRPNRFGGPDPAPVELPGNFFEQAALAFRSPDEVAEMTLRAVRLNRPMVVTDPSQRENFRQGYVDLVMGAFDDVEAFDRGASRASHRWKIS